MNAHKIDRMRWQNERQRIDCVALAVRLIGRPPDRRDGKRAWWSCPFHEGDRKPSFAVTVGPGGHWRCFGCGVHGDAAELVMQLCSVDFPAAKAQLLGLRIHNPVVQEPKRHAVHLQRSRETPTVPRSDVDRCVAEYAAALDRDDQQLEYLARRGIRDDTRRLATLGYVAKGMPSPWRWKAPGITIPWIKREYPTLLKLRPNDDYRARLGDKAPPKYVELWRDANQQSNEDEDMAASGHRNVSVGLRLRYSWYPELPEFISKPRPHDLMPLVVAEGELDCLLLRQELASLGWHIHTFGAASMMAAQRDGRLPFEIRTLINTCFSCVIVATDADPAGEAAAQAFGQTRTARCIPPAGKDWTDAWRMGFELRTHFTETLWCAKEEW